MLDYFNRLLGLYEQIHSSVIHCLFTSSETLALSINGTDLILQMPQLDRVVCHTLQLEFGVRTSSLGKQYKREMVPVCKNVDIAEKQQKKNKNEL